MDRCGVISDEKRSRDASDCAMEEIIERACEVSDRNAQQQQTGCDAAVLETDREAQQSQSRMSSRDAYQRQAGWDDTVLKATPTEEITEAIMAMGHHKRSNHGEAGDSANRSVCVNDILTARRRGHGEAAKMQQRTTCLGMGALGGVGGGGRGSWRAALRARGWHTILRAHYTSHHKVY